VSLAPGENQTKKIGTGLMQAGNSQNVSWMLVASLSMNGTVGITADGMISGSVIAHDNYAAYDYSDRIGATVNFTVNFNTSPYHDVAVTAVTPSKTVVGQGYFMNVSATIANSGTYAETFNVTAYANTALIETEEVTLTSGNSTQLVFRWNTTGFAYGNYTLSAYAWPVAGETNTANNNFTDGAVTVTIPGDVNADGTVNILDAIILGKAFFATSSSSNWNPNADINGDGVVDILDAIILANHFLQHYP
jgi:hypothetical protein